MKKLNNKGFSLVELIIVIAIMAVLAGALAPALITYIEKSRIKKFQKEINPELEYQIKVQRNKLHSLGINTDDYEYDN